MKLKNILVNLAVVFLLFFIQQKWFHFLDWITVVTDRFDTLQVTNLLWYSALRALISMALSCLILLIIKKFQLCYHFRNSYLIIRWKILRRMGIQVDWPENRYNNRQIDGFIRSPLEYVSETLRGNQAPSFFPDDDYQDVIFGGTDEIKYIVAITAENPNLFMDPTIGFYMSNCYAASLIRHVNDFIKESNNKTDCIPQLCVQDLKTLKKSVNIRRLSIINQLINQRGIDSFEFIRFFIYDEKQERCCDQAIFPSLKASQDLFRTLSFYVQKEKLTKNLKSKTLEEGTEWDNYHSIIEELWSLYDDACRKDPEAKKVQRRRIKNTIPEFLFVFYQDGVEMHTFLAGHYWELDRMVGSDAERVYDLIKILAEYVNEDVKKGQLHLDGLQKNKKNTFINWKWVPKSTASSADPDETDTQNTGGTPSA